MGENSHPCHNQIGTLGYCKRSFNKILTVLTYIFYVVMVLSIFVRTFIELFLGFLFVDNKLERYLKED